MLGRTILLAGLCIWAVPAAAQTQSESSTAARGSERLPAATAALDPERIEAARELLDIMMPTASREAMMIAMIEPMMDNLEDGMLQSPELDAALTDNPDVRALFVEFMAVQRERSLESARANLPSMMEAMSRAYARRFTRREMREIGTFFETPAGQAYLQQSNSIMSDPDIATWQRRTMTESMQHLQADIQDFTTRLSALQGGETAAPPRPVTNSNLDAMRGGTEAAEPETEE